MILYIGNNITSKTVSVTTINTLSALLKKEGYDVKISSSIKIQFFRLVAMICSIFKYRRKIDYVLIDTYSTKNFYYALLTSQLCRILSLKYMPMLHGGNLPERLDKSPKLSRMVFVNSYCNITPSPYLESEFKAKGYKTIYIPNVLEIQHYNYLERNMLIPKLLYVRAFAKIYNPEMAIKVLNEVKKEYPKAILCMIGPEKDESFKACNDLVKLLKLEDSIKFTGMLSKQEWHKKSEDYNIFINTTNIDNTPVSVLEAMALGLPVVSTNVGGLPYLINDGIDGLLVEKDNVDAMENAIVKICQDEELASTLANNARVKVEQFDWKIVKHLWHKILR